MSNSKFLDQSGVQSLWSKILNEDYVNSGTLTTIINAIDETKQDKITGAASTITNSNLTSNRVLTTDGSGKVAASGLYSGQLNYLSNVDGDIQEQIDQAELMAKLALPGTLKWDGVIGEREHVIVPEDNGVFALVHMYDDAQLATVIPEGNIEFIYSTMLQGNHEVGTETLIELVDGLYVGTNSMICYVPYDNYSPESFGITFPKRGIYFVGIYDPTLTYCYAWTQAIYCPDFPVAIPDYHAADAYFEKVAGTNSEVVSVGDTLTWDGNIGDRATTYLSDENVSGLFVKVSSSTPTFEELNLESNEINVIADGIGSTYPLTNDWETGAFVVKANDDVTMVVVGLYPLVAVVYSDNCTKENIHFPSAGTYFFKGELITNQNPYTTKPVQNSSLYVEGYNFLVEETAKETILKTEHLPADLRHVGAAFDTFVDGNSTIEWDGVIGDRTTVTIQDDIDFYARAVHISDYVPKISVTDQNIIVKWYFDNQPAEFVGSVMKQSEGVYGITIEFNDTTMPVAFIMEQDNTSVSVDSETFVFPKKGIYFHCLSENIAYTLSISAPFLSSYSVQLKESALPSSIFETAATTSNVIEWDGVIGDRVTVQSEGGEQLVHVSDETPDISVFTEQGFTVKVSANGETIVESFTPEDIAGDEFIIIVEGNNCYSLVDHAVFVVLEDNYTSSEKGVTFPKKGVYFVRVNASDSIYYILSVSSPLLAAPSTKVQLKESALPETMFEVAEKSIEAITWDGTSGEIFIDEGEFLIARVSNYAPSKDVFTKQGFNYTLISGGDLYQYEISANDAINSIDSAEELFGSYSYSITTAHNDSNASIVTVVTQDNVIDGKIIQKGMYFWRILNAYCTSITSPLMTQPAIQIKESALPDSIKKPADWKQDDPTQLDYIANRPFYDEWDSVIFDSSRFVGNEGIPFEFDGEVNLAFAQFSETDFAADFNRIIPNKTYTIAIGDYVYTGTSFELSEDGVTGVGIGNMSIFGELPEGMPTGDTNANLFVAYGPDSNGVNSVTLMTSKITESGNHWMAIVEGDSLKKTIAKEEGESTAFGVKISDKYITEDDLKRGFSLTISHHSPTYDGKVYTQNNIKEWSDAVEGSAANWLSINKSNWLFTDLPDDALTLCFSEGVYSEILISLKEDTELTARATGKKIIASKGTYFTYHIENYATPTEFTLNQSTIFTPYTPIKKIDKKYLPDQIQSSWNQNDSEQPDFIKDKPFYDGWSSVLFDSKKHMGGDVQFIDVEDGVVGFYSTISSLTSMGIDVSAIKPNKTYTLAVDNKRYTSTAFEITEDGMSGVCIGNIGVMLGDTTLGDPNADFLLAYSDNQDMFLLLMLDDTTIGDHWFAIVEGDKIGDTVTKDDRGTGYFNDGLFYNQIQNVSDNVITKNDLVNGFEIVIEKSDGSTVTLTQDDVFIEDYFLTAAGAAEGFGIGVYERALYDKESGVSNPIMGISPKEQMIQDDTNNRTASVSKGIYFLPAIDFTADVVSFKINNSTVFAPSTPIKQLDEKYIPDTIARVADIEKQVQSDWNQHNTNQRDHILNRPFWPEWSPVMVLTDYYDEVKLDGKTCLQIVSKKVPDIVAPMEGKRYIFGFADKTYSGIATCGVYTWFDDDLQLNGIGIVAEQDSSAYAFYRELVNGERRWYVVLPETDYELARSHTPFAVIEGDSFYNKLSAADDKLDMTHVPEGVSVVQDLTNLYKKANSGDKKANAMITALKNDVEITFDMNGTEYTQLSANLTFVADTNMMGFDCDLYMYGEAPLAGIVHDGDARLLALLDVKTVMGEGPTTKSFKVNFPGIFAPNIPAKKVPVECLPDDIGGGTNEEEVNAIIAAPKTQFTLIDQVTGENYIVCMRDGNLVTYKAQ